MLRKTAVLLVSLAFFRVASAPGIAEDPDTGIFLVRERGYALLGPDGKETKRLETINNAAGALSPDGRWIVFSKSAPNVPPGNPRGRLAVQSLVDAQRQTMVPLLWGTTGSSLLPIWSSDSSQILICEQGLIDDGTRESVYRVFDLASRNLKRLKVPSECWVNDWSADGKRLLTTARPDDGPPRIAWVNADGTGSIKYITSEDEVAYSARLSPDGRRILCMIGPKVPQEKRSPVRLSVIDLSTNKRTIVDQPGETHGHCWSADGTKIAYTWQRSLDNPGEVAVRETMLITCNADGSNRKIVTSRKYEVPSNSSGQSGVIYFFDVLDWR